MTCAPACSERRKAYRNVAPLDPVLPDRGRAAGPSREVGDVGGAGDAVEDPAVGRQEGVRARGRRGGREQDGEYERNAKGHRPSVVGTLPTALDGGRAYDPSTNARERGTRAS